MTRDYLDKKAISLATRIPEGHAVAGLEYGAFVSLGARSGYYVQAPGADRWGIAQQTPASDELPGSGADTEIVAAIRAELED